jgi:hypothetical protein
VVSDRDGTLIDPEFDPTGSYMAWVDRQGQLWCNDLDRDTGTWTPRDGRQVCVDSSLTRVGRTRQGIEWASGPEGPRMVYTRETASGPALYQARRMGRTWAPAPLEGGEGLWLFQTSKDAGDPHPRVIFRREMSPTRFGWRELDQPSSQEWIPGIHQQVLWLNGARAAVGVDSDLVPFLYDVDARTFHRPTARGTRHSFPSGFRSGSETTVLCVLDDTRIGVYRVKSGEWILTRTLRPESALPFVFHPKLWFHGKRALLTFMMATEKSGRVQNTRGVAEVWVAALANDPPRYRRVNDPSVERIKDTEGLSLPGGFFVYYAQILPDHRRLIHRCRSGW